MHDYTVEEALSIAILQPVLQRSVDDNGRFALERADARATQRAALA